MSAHRTVSLTLAASALMVLPVLVLLAQDKPQPSPSSPGRAGGTPGVREREGVAREPAPARSPPSPVAARAAIAGGSPQTSRLQAVAREKKLTVRTLIEGDLNAGDISGRTIQLESLSYSVVGFCDSDCTDLDIDVAAVSPRVPIASTGPAASATPVLTVTPASAGSYTVTITMRRCSANPCAYSVGVLSP